MTRALRLGLILWTAFMAFFPLLLVLPGDSLDDGWIIVLGEALNRGWTFGRDIVFTGGPLSSLYTGYVADGDFFLIAGLRIFLALAVARLFWRVLARAPVALFVAALLILSGGAYVSFLADLLLMAIPLLFAVAILDAPQHKLDPLTLALGVSASALVALVKFSSMVMALPAFLILDVAGLAHRRPPLLSVLYVVAVATAFAMFERGLSGFGGFLYYSFAMTATYADAMGSYLGSTLRLGLFALAATSFAILIVVGELRLWKYGERPADAVLRPLIMLLFLFLAWKAGFVRQDRGHEPTAWAGLGLVCILEATAWSRYPDYIHGPRRALTSALGIGAALMIAAAATGALTPVAHPADDLASALDERLGNELREIAPFAASPRAWLEAKQQERIAAWQRVRDRIPLPKIEGSVDIISSKQAALIANGLLYQPRMTIQEYAAFAAPLIEANRRSLIPPSGPDALLVEPGSIDGRYPSLAEGPLWPDILRTFRPVRLASGLAVMQRRETPLPSLLRSSHAEHISLGETVPVRAGLDPVFISLTLRKSFLGSFLSLLLKPNPVMIDIETNKGRRFTYRLIPAIAEAGFVLSPHVSTAEDFLALAQGLPSGSSPETVSSFRLREEMWWPVPGIDLPVYRRDVEYLRQDIDVSALRNAESAAD